MGEITPLDKLTSDVPGRVKKGGYEGNESKRIERHIEAHVLEHFKKACPDDVRYLQEEPFRIVVPGLRG